MRFLLPTVLLAGRTWAQQPSDSITATERARVDSIFAPYADPAAPGCAVGVYRGSRVVYAEGYGGADLERGVRITPSTRFSLASVSKQFTAAAVLLLARQGRLGLDDDVRRYLPDVPDFGTRITIRHLLTHTSGLREFDTLLQLSDWPGTVLTGDERFTPRDFHALLRRQRSLNFRPGSDWFYSNTGYVLLAEIVAKVTGRSLRQFADSAIFQPLGMRSTAFIDDHAELVPDRAVGYSITGSPPRFRRAEPGSDLIGHSGMMSTVEDLARWSGNFSEPRIGDSTLFAQMERSVVMADGEELTYGMGLLRGSVLGHRTIAHSGGLRGFSTDLIRVPDQRLAVATLCNRRTPGATGLAERTLAVFLKRAGTASATVDTARASSRPTAKADSALTGIYLSASTDQWVRIRVGADGSLEAESGARPTRLIPSNGSFTSDGAVWRFTDDGPTSARRLEVDHLGLPPRTRYSRGVVAARKRPDPALAGRYWSEELLHDVVVSTTDTTVSIVLTESHGPTRLTEVASNWFVAGPLTVHFSRGSGSGSPRGLSLTLFGARHLQYRRCVRNPTAPSRSPSGTAMPETGRSCPG